MFAGSFTFASLLLGGLVPLVLSADLVPVFIWDSSRNSPSSEIVIPALSKVGKDKFRLIIKEKLKDNPVVLAFAEENLSIEDLSWQDESGEGAFPHLSNLSRSGEADLLFLPFVDSPLDVLKHMFPATHPNWNEASVGPEGIPILSEDTPDSNYLRVNLKDAKDSDGRPDLLKRHDASIADIYKRARQKHNHVVAIYTAHHSSWHVEEGTRSRRIRDTNDEVNKESTDTKGESIDGETPRETPESEDRNKEQEEEDRDKETEREKENEKERGRDRKEKGEEQAGTETPKPTAPSTTIPVGPTPAPEPLPPFMTIPILSGLFVSSILLGILSVAISAMMDIKPTLRFDDPKGKPLTIGATEG